MLHHIPTSQAQSDLLVGAFRALRPGGVFIGADSLASNGLRDFHDGDTYNPVAPPFLLARLLAIGFTGTTMVVDDDLRFIARKPNEGGGGTNLGNEKEVAKC